MVIALVAPPGELGPFWDNELTLFCASIKLRINSCWSLDMVSNVAFCAVVRKAATTAVAWELTLAASGADALAASPAVFSFTELRAAAGAAEAAAAIARDVALSCAGCC